MARILIVEDEQYLRDLYAELLKSEGHQIELAQDGEKALELMQKGGYDLVLLDLILPKISGVEILKSLQEKHSENENKTILILTNVAKDSTIADAVTLGIKGYLIKSELTPQQLVEEVKKHL